MTDLISRADAICEVLVNDGIDNIVDRINALPSSDAVSREEYEDIIKDYRKQYENMNNEIADLEAKLLADAVQGWTPCSERLPEDSGYYLVCPSDGVIEDYSDCRDVMIMPYDADCEAFGWWTERYDPISLGFVDSDFNEFEVLAWMPLPKPYRKDGEA